LTTAISTMATHTRKDVTETLALVFMPSDYAAAHMDLVKKRRYAHLMARRIASSIATAA
jgi:hypothetical protein